MFKEDTEKKLIIHFIKNQEYTAIASISTNQHYLSLLDVFEAKVKFVKTGEVK